MIYVGIYADAGTFPRNIQFIHHQLKTLHATTNIWFENGGIWIGLHHRTCQTFKLRLIQEKSLENVNKKKAGAEEQRHFGSFWYLLISLWTSHQLPLASKWLTVHHSLTRDKLFIMSHLCFPTLHPLHGLDNNMLYILSLSFTKW